MVDEVLDARAFKLFGLGKQQLVVLVHSGSRGLGESILRDYVDEHQASGADAESFAAAAIPPRPRPGRAVGQGEPRAPRSALRATARCRG